MIGINTAIIADGRQSGNIGIGFAIPINTVRELLPQLRTGKITRGRIGIGVEPMSPRGGRRVRAEGPQRRARQRPSPPAARRPKAGLEPGDVIIDFNGKPVRPATNWFAWWWRPSRAATVPVRIVRDRQERTVNITVEELDLDAENRACRATASRDDPAADDEHGLRA